MQRNDLAEKKRVTFDGEEIPGLVNIQEITLEKGQLEVPEFSRIRRIQNGITTIPAIEMTYKIARDTNTLDFFKTWYFENEEKDVTVIRTDAAGTEFARTLLPSCECVRYQEPAFDAANPTYAQVSITVAPWDVLPISAE
jgi:transcriptional regulator with XRE-family HTH domain